MYIFFSLLGHPPYPQVPRYQKYVKITVSLFMFMYVSTFRCGLLSCPPSTCQMNLEIFQTVYFKEI